MKLTKIFFVFVLSGVLLAKQSKLSRLINAFQKHLSGNLHAKGKTLPVITGPNENQHLCIARAGTGFLQVFHPNTFEDVLNKHYV